MQLFYWTGKLYSAKRNKWFDVVIKNVDDTLEKVVSAGFRRKNNCMEESLTYKEKSLQFSK